MGMNEIMIREITDRVIELCKLHNAEKSKIEIDVGVSSHHVDIILHQFEKGSDGTTIRKTRRLS